jgi:serine/threonine protein kinase
VRAAAPPDIAGYRYIKNLGAGGNAQVYLYQQELPRREVAVKVLNESALSEAARSRFTAEADVTASLSHRHIVQVFDAKVTRDGRPYLVMPYYPQPNLSVRARREHFSVPQVLRIGIQIGSAVETSHRGGVLHRDIKPQNILTDSYGEPALTDFGIATTKGVDGPEGLSVPWSPPEILFGTGPGDERSDVYSLGATLWHLLAGHSPFELVEGDNKALALVNRIKSDPVPGTGRADVPASLERLLRQTMAKDPAARPQTAMELIRGLQSAEQELRLPVTQPVLPSGGAAPAPGGETTGLPAVRTGETTHSRGSDQGRGSQPARPGSVTEGLGRGGPGPTGTASPGTPGGSSSAWGPAGGSPGAPVRAPAWADSGTPARTEPRVPSPGAPGGDDDPTRRSGPRRIDPWAPAPGAWPREGRIGNVAQPEQRGATGDTAGRYSGSGNRARQFPPEAPEPATQARPRRLAPDGIAPGVTVTPGAARAGSPGSPGSPGRPGGGRADTSAAPGAVRPGRDKRGRGPVLALAGGGAALAVLAAVAVLTLAHGGQPGGPADPAVQPTQAGGGQNAIAGGVSAPGIPVMDPAVALSGSRVEFSWKYGNAAAGDSFAWELVRGTRVLSKGVAGTAKLVVDVPAGTTECLMVQVNRDGEETSPSLPACWPQ